MKALILMIISGFALNAQALGTYHKTADGKYPHYYVDKAGTEPWNEADQTEYDDVMDQAIDSLCFKTAQVERAQETINNEKEVGKSTGYVDAKAVHDAGLTLNRLKKEIEPVAKIIKDETGKDASSYECP